MDLNRVSVFVRVVEEGGFTAAARALGLPKSSVSRAVALLEEELGARLLQRTTRRVSLTEAGAEFHARASRGLAAVDEAREAVVELAGSLRGPIRVTAPVDVGAWVLAPIVADFAGRHPEVHVEVALTSRVVDIVREGFDLALRAGEMKDSSLIARRLRPTPFALYAAASYLAEHGTPRALEDLAAHRCVLFRADRGRTTWHLTGPDGEQHVEVAGPVGGDDLSFVLHAARAGAGIALLPDFAAGTGELDRVLPDYTVPGTALHVVYPTTRYLPRRVAALRDAVVDALS